MQTFTLVRPFYFTQHGGMMREFWQVVPDLEPVAGWCRYVIPFHRGIEVSMAEQRLRRQFGDICPVFICTFLHDFISLRNLDFVHFSVAPSTSYIYLPCTTLLNSEEYALSEKKKCWIWPWPAWLWRHWLQYRPMYKPRPNESLSGHPSVWVLNVVSTATMVLRPFREENGKPTSTSRTDDGCTDRRLTANGAIPHFALRASRGKNYSDQ